MSNITLSEISLALRIAAAFFAREAVGVWAEIYWEESLVNIVLSVPKLPVHEK